MSMNRYDPSNFTDDEILRLRDAVDVLEGSDLGGFLQEVLGHIEAGRTFCLFTGAVAS